MSTDPKIPRRKSEPPFEALKKERDEFLKTFFRKGAQLTEELVKERDSARVRVTALEEENARLRSQIESDKTLRDFMKKIEELETEKASMLARCYEAEQQSTRFEASSSEIESELSSLANLYVASYQLHASLNPRGAMRHIKELLAQLVGADVFALYLIDRDKNRLIAIASQGLSDNDLAPIIPTEGAIGEAFAADLVKITEGDTREGTLASPAALIPLSIDGRVVGVLAVIRTLQQKQEFVAVDHELFKLLGAQAVTSLVASKLFSDNNRELPPLASFLDLGA